MEGEGLMPKIAVDVDALEAEQEWVLAYFDRIGMPMVKVVDIVSSWLQSDEGHAWKLERHLQ